MNKIIINNLADCFAFLDLKPTNALECYVFENEQWQFFQKSVHEVYHSSDETKKILKILEDFLFEIKGPLSSYLRNKKKYEEKFGNVVDFDIVTSPVLIYKKINETKNLDELKILFAFYLEHISSSELHQTICYKASHIRIINSKLRSISLESYNVKKEGNRLPKAFLNLIRLSELSLKITKYWYTYELDKLELIIQQNQQILYDYLQNRNTFHNKKWGEEKEHTNNIYNLYEIYVRNGLEKALRLLAQSSLYSNYEEFYIHYGKLYDCLDNITPNFQINFEKSKTTFTCTLFEKAENAYNYGIISQKKFKNYESKLKGNELKQISRTRENLLIQNYVAKDNEKPVLRSSKWSILNEKFYKNTLEKSFKKEEELNIDFTSFFYSGYLSEYVKNVFIETYKTSKYNYLAKSSCHLSRVLKMYGSTEGIHNREINIVKGMLLDAGEYEEYNQFTKWSLTFSGGNNSLYEIVSVQNKLGEVLPFSGELFLSQIYRERENKLIQLFSDDIISYLNDYIESEKQYFLPFDLFQKFSDPVFLETKFDEIKKIWIEEKLGFDNNFKFDKKKLVSEVRKFNLKNEEYDVYEERFQLLKLNNIEASFDFVKVPQISIPNGIIIFINTELNKIFKNLINQFKEERELKIGDDRWISEKHLFQNIKEKFPELTIIYHASPDWLGRQHFDIYIPSKQIAIEYNGRQHYQPIEYFGGVEGFHRRVELDQKKLRKANENNCSIIIHKFDEEIEKTLNKIKQVIND